MRLASKLDRGTAIVMIVFFASLLYLSFGLGYWDGYAPAAGFMPIWVALVGIVLATILLVSPAAERRPSAVEPAEPGGLARVSLSLASLVLFAALTPFLGMVPAGFVLMLFLLLVVFRRPVPISLAVSLVSTALVYAIFVAWLNVALPKGVIGL